MCSEADWTLEAAVAHLRSITALACGNPYLMLERVFGKQWLRMFFRFETPKSQGFWKNLRAVGDI